MPSSISAETMAAIGFDYCCIDMQHGLIDFSDMVPMLQGLTVGATTPFVRVPQNLPGHIGKALDAGAMGVIVPMVNSVEECEAAIAAGRYAPAGSRSYGPGRAAPVEGADYWERANSDVAIVPMIETVEALASLDEILAVDGVEAIYVGPADLSISMGFHPRGEEPAFLQALDDIVEACGRHGVVPGMHTTSALAPDRIERGFRMLTITSDLLAMRTKLADEVDLVRKGVAGAGGSIY
ncbi:MAG: aldolase/citrate lyase family protein [Acidimicrobiia bacterium]|nr:aldolase/citrate lyase family protein [Acidimicrobiia bacterium]